MNPKAKLAAPRAGESRGPGSLNLLFSALSDPTRRSILERLVHGSMSVTEVASPYGISLPAISKHLAYLETAGLITRRREGRVFRCEINATPLISAATWLGRYKRIWDMQLDSLGSYLDDAKKREARKDAGKL